MDVSFREVEGSSGRTEGDHPAPKPASLLEQPPMHGGKERKGNLSASQLCLARNAGFPGAGHLTKEGRDLYGNGVVIVPNVPAVTA